MTDEIQFEETFREKFQEQAKAMGRFNLAIFGKTGVGKSTLVNAVFGEEVAPTGIGEPVTMNNHLYLHKSGFMGLVDTRGLEIGKDTDELIEELSSYVKEMRNGSESEHVHVAWYCVRATDRRFEDTEAEFVRRLHKLGLPVLLVLTQVTSRNGEYHHDAIELAAHISGLGLPIAGGQPILVMADGDEFTGQVEHGLKTLLDATFRVVPEGVAAALAAAQKVDMARKRKDAHTAVQAAAVSALAVGVVPIPLADAALLVPIQLAMMARVAAIYGLKLDTAAIASTAITTVLVAGGKSAVVGLTKLVPGAGTIVGGAISAGVASTLTLATGFAWAAVCQELTLGRLRGVGGAIDSTLIHELFRVQYAAWFENANSRVAASGSSSTPE
ncbi:GTPase family protein [Microterricola viridarii]|uniref:Uncharacterized conserved protein, DUF697 family n=1 Tax=Microterricola viridarii TaxID=412690 RepID=A0A1H1WP14_9MICO|nr:GTPase [Microterricola viridarii]SDS98410.1 Uncharacterized conserved protein, DUF697 family [Microterricola viridarii]